MRIAKRAGWTLVWIVALLSLAIVAIPHFLDRIYYRGAPSDHFDGQRFFNPDGADDVAALPGHGGRLGFFWRYLTAGDARPAWPEHVAIAPVAPPARVGGGRMLVTWVGHSSVLVQTQGLNILTDPVWSVRAGPYGIGPRRVTPPGIAFDALPRIDVVLISHDHYDHLDLATLARLWARDHPRIVTSLGNDALLRGAGIAAVARDWGGRVTLRRGIDVIVTRNHHWGTRWLADRNRSLWSSFVVTLPGGNLFFAGDTGMGDGRWIEAARGYGPIRLALLPIGAFRFTPGQMAIGSHIGPVDAVDVYRRLGASRAIAIHWGTFRQSYEARDTPPRLLAAAERCTGQRGFDAAPVGRPLEIASYAPPRAAPAMPRDALLRCLDTPAVRALR